MAKAPSPNYTQSPNVYFDSWLKEINSLAELKVVNVIIRHTFGWHKEDAAIGTTELMDLTGLSRVSVVDGVKRALEHGYIVRQMAGPKTLASYRISVEMTGKESIPDEIQTGKESIPDTGKGSIPDTGKESLPPYKDKEKEKESRKKGEEAPSIIFNFWKLEMGLPEAQFTDDRERAIRERLNDSTVEEIKAAIRGCKLSDFHMGRESGKPQRLNGIEFICQKRSRLESFISMAPADNGRTKPPPTETEIQRLVRENCQRCHGTRTEVIPGKGGKACDHKTRSTDGGSSGNGSTSQDSESCIPERSDRHLRAVQ